MDWIIDQIDLKTCSCFSLHPQIPSKEQILKAWGKRECMQVDLTARWNYAHHMQETAVAEDENAPRYAPSSEVLEMRKALGW